MKECNNLNVLTQIFKLKYFILFLKLGKFLFCDALNFNFNILKEEFDVKIYAHFKRKLNLIDLLLRMHIIYFIEIMILTDKQKNILLNINSKISNIENNDKILFISCKYYYYSILYINIFELFILKFVNIFSIPLNQ